MAVYASESGDVDGDGVEVEEPEDVNVDTTTNNIRMRKKAVSNPEFVDKPSISKPDLTSNTDDPPGTPIEKFFAKIEINSTRHPLSNRVFGTESELSSLIDKKFSSANPFNDYAAYVLMY
jgi:hypothetical protein